MIKESSNEWSKTQKEGTENVMNNQFIITLSGILALLLFCGATLQCYRNKKAVADEGVKISFLCCSKLFNYYSYAIE